MWIVDRDSFEAISAANPEHHGCFERMISEEEEEGRLKLGKRERKVYKTCARGKGEESVRKLERMEALLSSGRRR